MHCSVILPAINALFGYLIYLVYYLILLSIFRCLYLIYIIVILSYLKPHLSLFDPFLL